MKWMPKWIGKRYAKLWIHFKEGIFMYDEAKPLFKKYTSNYLSELKRCQALVVFEKHGRKRLYRLIPPKYFIYSYAYNINLDSLLQTPYAHLLVKFFYLLKEELEDKVLSMGLFGSVAKGTAEPGSDIDLLIITEGLDLTLVERTEYILKLKRAKTIKEEIEFLHSYGYTPKINFIIKEKNELKVNFFTIDISFDMIILYDTGALNQFLAKIKEKIKQQGIEKKYYEKQKYYLDLDIDFGEVYEF